jgi:hypothetical protein
MHCPNCNHAFGERPGVPSEPLGLFTATVRCAECGRDVPHGSLLLVGASVVDAVGPITRSRRIKQSLRETLPAIFLLYLAVSNLQHLSQGAAALSSVRVYVGLAALWGFFAFAWSAWRRWGASGGEDPRAAVSWELQWLVSTHGIEIFDRRRASPVHSSPRARKDDTHVAAADGGPKSITTVPPQDIRYVRASVPGTLITGADGRPRSGVMMHLGTWTRSRSGRRRAPREISICVDAGAADDQAGLDHRSSAQSDGDSLAQRVRAIVTGCSQGLIEGTVRVEGQLHAMRPWPQPMRTVGWALVLVWLFTGCPLATLGSATALGPGRGASGGVVMVAIGVALLAAVIAIHLLSARRLRRKSIQRTSWTVTGEGVRIQSHPVSLDGRDGPATETIVRCNRIARISLKMAAGRPRIALKGADGSSIAELSPDISRTESGQGIHEAMASVLGCPADTAPVR